MGTKPSQQGTGGHQATCRSERFTERRHVLGFEGKVGVLVKAEYKASEGEEVVQRQEPELAFSSLKPPPGSPPSLGSSRL